MVETQRDIPAQEDDAPPHEGSGIRTRRALRRAEEEVQWRPVIIKRVDDVGKHPDDVLQQAIDEGHEQVNRTAFSLVLSAVSAGLILGFAAMAVSFAIIVMPEGASGAVKRLAMGVVYPLGFIICVMSRTELFTEHTALAVYPYLDKLCTAKKVFRLWALVFLGNMIGTAISAGLLTLADPIVGAREGYIYVADHLLNFSFWQIFVSAMLAGWLMSLGGWLVISMSSAGAQIVCIYIVTFLIGIGGLHHSIAGSAEVFTAWLQGGGFGPAQIGLFLLSAASGNLVGGSVFVAGLNYAHIRRTQKFTPPPTGGGGGGG